MASLLLPAVLLDFVWLFLVFLLPAIVAVYHRGYIAWTHFAVPARCSIEHHDPVKLFLPKLIPKSAVKKKRDAVSYGEISIRDVLESADEACGIMLMQSRALRCGPRASAVGLYAGGAVLRRRYSAVGAPRRLS